MGACVCVCVLISCVCLCVVHVYVYARVCVCVCVCVVYVYVYARVCVCVCVCELLTCKVFSVWMSWEFGNRPIVLSCTRFCVGYGSCDRVTGSCDSSSTPCVLFPLSFFC